MTYNLEPWGKQGQGLLGGIVSTQNCGFNLPQQQTGTGFRKGVPRGPTICVGQMPIKMPMQIPNSPNTYAGHSTEGAAVLADCKYQHVCAKCKGPHTGSSCNNAPGAPQPSNPLPNNQVKPKIRQEMQINNQIMPEMQINLTLP